MNTAEARLIQSRGRGVALPIGPRAGGDALVSYARASHARFDEAAAVAALLSDHRPDARVVDVGANRGFTVAPFVERGWQVLALEPEPVARGKLEKRFGDHPSVTIDPRAVGDEERSEVPFFTSEESAGIGTLAPFRDSHTETARVDVTTLDRCLREHHIDRVDFLKIDTEGYDLFVLRGFPWDRLQPRVILTEFEDAKSQPLGYDFHALARLLLDRGYVVYASEWYPVRRYGVRHDWHCLKRYPAELEVGAAWGNLIAFDPELGLTDDDVAAAVRAQVKLHGRDAPERSPDPAAKLVSLVSEARDPNEAGAQLAAAAYQLSSVVVSELALVSRHVTWPTLPTDTAPELAAAAHELASRVRCYSPAEAPAPDLTIYEDPRSPRGAAVLLDFVAEAQPGREYLRRRNLRALESLGRRLGRFDEVRVSSHRVAPPADGALRIGTLEDAVADPEGPMIVVIADRSALMDTDAAGRATRAELLRQAAQLGRTVVVPLACYAHVASLYPWIENQLLGLDDAMGWRPYEPADTTDAVGGTMLPLAARFSDTVLVYTDTDTDAEAGWSELAAHGVRVARGPDAEPSGFLETSLLDAGAREELAQLKAEAASRAARCALLEEGIEARDRRVRQLDDAVAHRDARIATLDEAVARRDARIATLDEAVARRDDRIARLEATSRRLRALLAAPRNGARWVLSQIRRDR